MNEKLHLWQGELRRDVDNAWWFYFYVSDFGWVSGERKKLMKKSSALNYLYVGQLLFFDRGWKNADQMESHHLWSWSRVSPSRIRKDKCLVSFDICEDLSGDFRSGHLVISADCCSEYEEGLFDVIADIFASMEPIVFMWSDLNSSIFISIVASIYDSAAWIFLPTLFLTIAFSTISPKYVVSE